MDTNAPLSERLRAIPLFEGLSHAERQKLVTHFEPVQFEGGARLCTEGSAGEALFILESGCVRVHKATQGDIEEEIAVLESGAVFGEVAVLDGRPCSATITALGPVRAYRLDNGDILRMRLSFEPALFKAFGNLTSTLCERLRAVNGRIGALMSQPELMAQAMRKRQLMFEARGEPAPPATGAQVRGPLGPDPLVVPIYDPGLGHPTPEAIGDFLGQLPVFQSLDRGELISLAEAMRELHVPEGGEICREGELGGDFYVLASGMVEVRKEAGEGEEGFVLATFKPGAMFGEVSLIDGGPRSASCVASEASTLLGLSRRDFELLWRANSAMAFRFMEIIGIDLSLCLRAADEQFTDLFHESGAMSPQHLDRLAELSALLELKTISTGSLRMMGLGKGE